MKKRRAGADGAGLALQGAWVGHAWFKQENMGLGPDGLAGEEGESHEQRKVAVSISRVWFG